MVDSWAGAILRVGTSAYSAQTDHPFRLIVTTCSAANCPLDRSEATLVFPYLPDLSDFVKDERILLMESPFRLRLWALWTRRSKNGIGQGRITDMLDPALDRDLGGNQRAPGRLRLGVWNIAGDIFCKSGDNPPVGRRPAILIGGVFLPKQNRYCHRSVSIRRNHLKRGSLKG